MKRILKLFFGNKATEDRTINLYTEEKFIKGTMTAEQLFELSQLFTEIPEYLENGNQQHLSNAVVLSKYCIDLTQLKHSHFKYSLTVLKYPKSSIYTAMLYILNDIEKNNGVYIKPYLAKSNLEVNKFYYSLMSVMYAFDALYTDIEKDIKSFGNAIKKPLDESILFFKSIVNNELPNHHTL